MKNVFLVILAAATGGLAVFSYFQNQSMRQQTDLIQKLSSKLEAPSGSATLALQEKCAKQAREEFNNLGWAKEPFASFTNHYNEKLRRCFVVIANTTATEKSVSVNKSLEDAFEGKEYAEFMWINNSGKKYWEVSPSICKVTLPSGQEQICNSSDEFDELIKPYME